MKYSQDNIEKNIENNINSFLEKEKNKESKVFYSLIFFVIIWTVIGFIAFITSLVCFSKSGTTFDKFMGLLLAIFLGPLYFVFFALSNSYCK
jgi:hypothetical protein